MFDSRPDADPVEICREALRYAELNGYDTVLLDTAGRLHIDAPLMEELNTSYPGLKAFSLPSMGEGGARRHIELGVRGAPGGLGAAMERLRRGIAELGGTLDIPNR